MNQILGPAETRRRAIEAQSNSNDLDAVDCCLSKIKDTMDLVNRQMEGCSGDAENVLWAVWEEMNIQCGKLIALKGRLETQ